MDIGIIESVRSYLWCLIEEKIMAPDKDVTDYTLKSLALLLRQRTPLYINVQELREIIDLDEELSAKEKWARENPKVIDGVDSVCDRMIQKLVSYCESKMVGPKEWFEDKVTISVNLDFVKGRDLKEGSVILIIDRLGETYIPLAVNKIINYGKDEDAYVIAKSDTTTYHLNFDDDYYFLAFDHNYKS